MKNALLNWLKSPLPFQPFYCVIGDEPYLTDEIKRAFHQHAPIGPASLKDFNFNSVDGMRAGAEAIVSVCETRPLQAAKRLVFVQSAECLKPGSQSRLISFIEEPQRQRQFILALFFAALDRRKKLYQALSKKAGILSAAAVREWERGPWIDYMAAELKIKFSPSARSLFDRLSGSRLLQLKMELEKLKSFMGEREKALDEDVLAIVSRTKTDTVFELTGFVGRRDKIQALNSLNHFLDQGQSPLGAHAMLCRHFRILARVQKGLKQRLSRAALAAMAGAPPFFLNEYTGQARLWSAQRLESAFEALFEAEKALKSSSQKPKLHLESLILKVC